MAKKMVCPRCGKEVEKVCAACWRCKNCKLDCKEHMKRTIDGAVGGKDSRKKLV